MSLGAVTHLGTHCQLVSKTQAKPAARSARAQEHMAHVFILHHPKEYQGDHSEISVGEIDFFE